MASYLLSREDPARDTGVLKTGVLKSACIKAD